MPLNIVETTINGVVAIENSSASDHRGSFSRLFCKQELAPILQEKQIVQINQSKTHLSGAIRGLHFQYPPYAEMKLVRCIKGKIWDVAVDLRADSPTFLQWHAEELTPSINRMIVIPEGCAHGFQVLDTNSELFYLHTEYYNPKYEGGIRHALIKAERVDFNDAKFMLVVCSAFINFVEGKKGRA